MDFAAHAAPGRTLDNQHIKVLPPLGNGHRGSAGLVWIPCSRRHGDSADQHARKGQRGFESALIFLRRRNHPNRGESSKAALGEPAQRQVRTGDIKPVFLCRKTTLTTPKHPKHRRLSLPHASRGGAERR